MIKFWCCLIAAVLLTAGCYASYMFLGATIDSVIMTLTENAYPFGPFTILAAVLFALIYRYSKKNRKIFLNPAITAPVILSALYAGICEDITWRALPIACA